MAQSNLSPECVEDRKISLDYYNLHVNKIISVEMVHNYTYIYIHINTRSIAFSVFPSPMHSVSFVVICWNSPLCNSSVQFVPPGHTGSRLGRPLSEHTARLCSLRWRRSFCSHTL